MLGPFDELRGEAGQTPGPAPSLSLFVRSASRRSRRFAGRPQGPKSDEDYERLPFQILSNGRKSFADEQLSSCYSSGVEVLLPAKRS
jgi:hypothetical protein